LALGCALLAVAGAQSPGCGETEVHKGVTGTWTVREGPQFSSGDSKIIAFAVDPTATSHQYATNGSVVMASSDAGCSWDEALALPAQSSSSEPLTGGNALIHALAARGGRVVATAGGPTSPTVITANERPYPADALTVVYHSEDGGKAWRPAAQPMPNGAAGPGALAQAPSDPKVVYLATGRQMRRSDDGGATFRLLGSTEENEVVSNADAAIEAIAVDPATPDTVVARGNFTAWRSTDGGQSFIPYQRSEGGPSDNTVFGPAFGRAGRVTFTQGDKDGQGVAHKRVAGWLLSSDGGATIMALMPDRHGIVRGELTSMAAGDDPDDLVMTTVAGDGGVAGIWRWYPKDRRVVYMDEFSLAPLAGAQAQDAPRPAMFFVHGSREIVTWETPPEGISDVPAPPVVTNEQSRPGGAALGKEPPQPEDVPKGPKAKLDPGSGDVRVPPGASTTVDYRLHLPRRPARLDTFFLMDSSTSTDPYIERVATSLNRLSESLVERGIDGWFGLGEYQDRGGLRYRRRADLRPPGEYLRRAFDTINTEGGEEPGYTALHQMATGSGILDPPRGTPVKPGQDAHWRTGTVRLALMAADEPFHSDPSGATPDETIAALNARDIHFIGLLVAAAPIPAGQGLVDCAPIEDVEYDDEEIPAVGQPNSAHLLCQMQKLARGTNTFAPKGGVDCDGNGIVDLPEGQPMVCVVTDGATLELNTIDDAVEQVMLSFPLKAPVKLAPKGTPPVAVEVAPAGDYGAVEARAGAEGTFAVKFTCGAEQAGKAFDVPLLATLGDLPIADATPRVVCGELPAAVVPPGREASRPPEDPAPAKITPEKAPVAIAPATQVPVLAPAPLPPPPPAPVPASVTAPASAPAPAPATSTSNSTVQASAPASAPAQVGAVAEETEPVVGFQTVRVEDEPAAGELNFNFVRNDHQDQLPWLLRTLGIAAVLAAGTGTALRRQTQKTLKKVTQR
jgi:hypothetical protein